jgi:ketosteroid isomerase-like protein
MGHPDEELVRRGYDAFSSGDLQTLRELFDPTSSGTRRDAANWPATTEASTPYSASSAARWN